MNVEAQLVVLGKALAAMVLGGLIGWEREIAGKPAGLRTNMLVAGSSALMVMMGEALVDRFEGTGLASLVAADPIRILEAVIVGVSFIGAGTIIQREREERVENLTTAATILFSAAIAVVVALDQWFLAIALTAIVLVVTFALGRLVARTGWGKSHDR